jgi:hypothetical protein
VRTGTGNSGKIDGHYDQSCAHKASLLAVTSAMAGTKSTARLG